MRSIAICDDNFIQRDIVMDMVEDISNENHWSATISTFESGDELLRSVEKNGRFDLYILDMIMEDMKGIELAKKLREKGDKGAIVFLTVTNAFEKQINDIDALDYIIKPLTKEKLKSVFSKFIG